LFNFLVIEVASGEHGMECIERLVQLIDNGRVLSWKPPVDDNNKYLKIYNTDTSQNSNFLQFEEEINPNNLKFKCSAMEQFSILFKRSSKQIYRNKVSEVYPTLLKFNHSRFFAELSLRSNIHAYFSRNCDWRTFLADGE
jgi:hypothetical protein